MHSKGRGRTWDPEVEIQRDSSFPGRSQRSEHFPGGAPWAGAPWPGRTVLCSSPNGLSSWLIHMAFGTQFPCIVTTLGNFASMQTISLLVKLKQGASEPEDLKLTGKPSFMQRNTQFLHSPLCTPLLLVGWTLGTPYQVIRESGHIVVIADTVCTTCFRAKQKIPPFLSGQQQ